MFRCNKLPATGATLAVVLLTACAGLLPAPENSAQATALERSKAQALLSVDQRVAFDRGVAALKDGNGVVAVEVFSDLSAQLPNVAALQANLGSAYMLRGDAAAAIEAYQRAVALNPRLATAYVRLGVLFRRADRLEEAETAYKAALNANPQNRLAHLNLGILYDIYLRHPAQALAQYQQFQALSEQPDNEVGLWIADLKKRL